MIFSLRTLNIKDKYDSLVLSYKSKCKHFTVCAIFLFDEIFLRPVLVKAIVVETFSLSLQTCFTFNQENPGFSSNYQNHL